MLSRSFLLAATSLALVAALPATTISREPAHTVTPDPQAVATGPPVATFDVVKPSMTEVEKPEKTISTSISKVICQEVPLAPGKSFWPVLLDFQDRTNGNTTSQTCAGSGACTVLANKDGAELSFCNNNKAAKCVNSHEVVNRAVNINTWCYDGTEKMSGQAFSDDDTNVIFKAA